jgi:hypothetical protein
MALVACSTKLTTTGSPARGPASGPPIPADSVGGYCSGVGTSPGDTTTFPKDNCPAGLCAADARDGFDSYCTADCDGHTCPKGFSCEALSLGDIKFACLKDGSATADDAARL